MKEELFNQDKDLNLILENLKNCLTIEFEIGKLDSNSLKSSNNYEDLLDLKRETNVFRSIMNQKHLIAISLSQKKVTKFLISVQNLVTNTSSYRKYFFSYISEFLNQLGNKNFHVTSLNFEFLSALSFNEKQFAQFVEVVSSNGEVYSDYFELCITLIIKHQYLLFENVDFSLLESMQNLNKTEINSIKLLEKSIRLIVEFSSTNNFDKIELRNEETRTELLNLFRKCLDYSPNLIRNMIQNSIVDKVLPKNLLKFSSKDDSTLSKLENLLENREQSKNEASKNKKQTEFDITKLKTVKELVSEYTYTLSEKDCQILLKIKQLDSKFDCLIFRYLNAKISQANSLYNQTKIADFISMKLDENVLLSTLRNYPLGRKLDSLDKLSDLNDEFILEQTLYDPVYVLPNMFTLLDYGK